MRAIKYAWECNFCGAGNAAGTNRCAVCRNNAIARPIDFDPRLQKEREGVERRAQQIESLPRSLRPVVSVLWGIVLFGVLIVKVAWTIGAMVAGLVIVAAAGIPAAIITRVYETHSPDSPRS